MIGVLMIYDLIEFGRWLNENNQDSFGKHVKDTDYILNISYENNKFQLNDFMKKEEICNLFYEKSIFADDLFIETDQKYMIPSKSNLLGLTPFFIKLDNDFLSKDGLKCDKIKKFKNKIVSSIKSNKNNNGFVNKLIELNDDNFDTFFNICSFDEVKTNTFQTFLKDYKFEDMKNRIIDYYLFLLNNYNLIVQKVSQLKKSDKYTNERFYLSCTFGDNFDMINDLFYFYSKFLKTRDNKIRDYSEGKCSFCNNIGLTYPSTGSFTLSGNNYSFNFNASIKNSRLRLCKHCNTYLRDAENKLMAVFNSNLLLIPKIKQEYDYTDFLKISNDEKRDLFKMNDFLRLNFTNFNFDLMLYTKEKGDIYHIKKYIENYNAFLVKFDNINLYSGNVLNYLFDEQFDKEEYYPIKNTFDLEKLFKDFFISVNDGKIVYPKFKYFYEIYIKDLKDILRLSDSKIFSIFVKYMNNIFSFIYELNFDALNKKILNDVVYNCLVKIQLVSNVRSTKYNILKRLNYYFMFKKEFLGDKMLKQDSINQLKKIFSNDYCIENNENSDNQNIVLSKEDIKSVLMIVEEDKSIKYYLLGQFINLIDKTKFANNKKGDIFSNFILNVNRNNIFKLFVTEILQKNNYYIEKMNIKSKIIFKLFENDLNNLFNEENFTFEDYIILLFTGYYTTNILSSKYDGK